MNTIQFKNLDLNLFRVLLALLDHRSVSRAVFDAFRQEARERLAALRRYLDEEAARLIQFQQSYQAAAKMLQIAQSIFDTLLQTAGR